MESLLNKAKREKNLEILMMIDFQIKRFNFQINLLTSSFNFAKKKSGDSLKLRLMIKSKMSSVMPEENLSKLKKKQKCVNNQLLQSNKKLFRLAPISNYLQVKGVQKASICANNMMVREKIEQINSKKSHQSINELLNNSQNHKQQTQDLVISAKLKSKSSIGNFAKQQLKQFADVRKPKQLLSSYSQISSPFNSNNRLVLQNKSLLESSFAFSPDNIRNDEGPNQTITTFLKISLFQYKTLICSKIQKLLESITFQIFITLLTICSLFMEDFRTIFVLAQNDKNIDYVNLFFLTAFSLEILMSLTVQNYPFSFFFYLDVISTLSICMDVTIFTDIIYNSGGNNQQISILVTQSKASRAAARAVRIMKIFRLARVVKLYKSAVKTKELNQQKQKERLKQKLKDKKNFKNMNSGFMNQNFQGQISDLSEHKLSYTNSLSLRDKELGMSQKSQNKKARTNRKGSNLRNQKNVKIGKDNINMINMINEEPLDQEGTQTLSNNQQRDSRKINDCYQNQIENQIFNPLQLSKQQSKISKILSDSTIKKIIIVILIIMFSMTALEVNNYQPDNTSWDFLTSYVAKLLKQPEIPIEHINYIIKKHIEYFQKLGINSQIVAFETPFTQIFSMKVVDYSTLRITQIGLSEGDININDVLKVRPNLTLNQDFVISDNSTDIFNSVTVVISYRDYNSIDSWFSIGKILFICLTIIYLLQSFNTNISDLIVTPIQKMLEIIINPDKKLQEDEDENKDFKEARYQTLIVQRAIIKIRGLMSTIFGRIGMDLVYKQLFKSQNITAINYLSVKKKSFCIYGVCKIQNFVQISQTLQADSFNFVNQIAKIVHSAVYRYGGYGVKNLPDGFLIVFKFPQGRQKVILEQANKSKYSKQKQNTYLNILCDFSIYSMVKMIARLHKEPKVLSYKKDQRILQKFGNNFQIEMNFSIGIGESIQGMIGSQFKIDPVYLGGKLDQILKLSEVARKYPNLIILEKQLFDNLTTGLKNHCRIFDYVKLNDYDDCSTELYAVDLDLQYISPSKSKAQKYKKKQDQPDIHLKKQLNMENLKNITEINNYYAQAFINSKKELREVLKKKISEDMRKKYQMAFRAYISGDWSQAKQSFEQIMRVIKEDVLSKRIYNFMCERGFKFNEQVKQYKSVKQL